MIFNALRFDLGERSGQCSPPSTPQFQLDRKARLLAKAPEKRWEKSSDEISNLLPSTPTLSAKALSARLGITPLGVEKQINLLKTTGKLRRIGPAKGGHWEVLE